MFTGSVVNYKKRYTLKRLLYIFGILSVLFSCDDGNIYHVKGQLSNFEGDTLFVVFESSESIQIETITCNEKGQFSIVRKQDDDFQLITFYYNDRFHSFNVYPEVGKPVQVKGDAAYPQLLQIKGGRINDKLSQFKRKAAPIIKELTDIQKNNTSLDSEEAMRQSTLNLELRKLVQDFVTKNPKEEASAVLISDYFACPDELEQTETLLRLLSQELNNFHLVRNGWKEIERAKATHVGAKAPDFKVTNIYGQTFTVDSLADRHFILAFTALWCDMCQTEVMMLDDIATSYAKDSLEILLICLDDNLKEIREAISQDTIQWNIVADSAGQAIQLFEQYNVNSLPKCFLMDQEGIIRLSTMSGEELKRIVDDIMNQ